MENNFLLILIIMLILMSSFFSVSETAFNSCNKIRLKYLSNNGNKKAKHVLDLLDRYASMISAILIGNNIANIVASTVSAYYFILIFPQTGAFISSVVITVLILFFGEIIPKTIAQKFPEKIALAIVNYIRFIVFVLKPILFIFNLLEKLIDLILKKDEQEQLVNEEFLTMVDEAKNSGDMDIQQADLLTNAIEFVDQDVNDILTPRIDVCAIELKEDFKSIENKFVQSGFSRLPVYKDTIDNIIGVLHEKEFYYHYYNKKDLCLDKIISEVIYTSCHIKIKALLSEFQKRKSHMAIVVDEYGGTEGIITMEDILEELVGEIYDEHDEVINYYNQIGKNTYIVDCDENINDFLEKFEIENDEEFEFNSLSAWIIYTLGKIPENGFEFTYQNIDFTIISSDNKTINKVKIVLKDKN